MERGSERLFRLVIACGFVWGILFRHRYIKASTPYYICKNYDGGVYPLFLNPYNMNIFIQNCE